MIAGAAVGIAAIGAALALADVHSPLRAPFTLFFLLAAPALAIGSALRGLDAPIRPVLAVAGALALDLLVAQAMLALRLWSARGGVAAVGCLSLLILVPAAAHPPHAATTHDPQSGIDTWRSVCTARVS